MPKKSGLGNALDELSIFDDDIFGGDTAGKNISTLKIGDIEPNRGQPRKQFDNEKIASLADSIAAHGIIQPITVRPYEGSYQIVAGERRWRAARMAGLTEVPVLIVELDDSQTMQIALIENLQREDLNPLEEAGGYNDLIERFNMKQEDVARQVGKARSSVTNALRLLSLPDSIKELVRNGTLSKGHCKALLGLSDIAQMTQLAQKTVSGGLSVRVLENLVKNASAPGKDEPAAKTKKSPLLTEAEISLQNSIGKTVRIKENQNKITIEIDVFSEDEVMEVVNRLSPQ
jgi:ParB family chromosome partitioning protein